jgi:hypothetical protein
LVGDRLYVFRQDSRRGCDSPDAEAPNAECHSDEEARRQTQYDEGNYERQREQQGRQQSGDDRAALNEQDPNAARQAQEAAIFVVSGGSHSRFPFVSGAPVGPLR